MTAVIELPYTHHIEQPPAEPEEGAPEPKNSIKEETNRFSTELTQLADNLVKYRRFREKVEIKPLAAVPQPDDRLGSQPRSVHESYKEGTSHIEGEAPADEAAPPAEGEE